MVSPPSLFNYVLPDEEKIARRKWPDFVYFIVFAAGLLIYAILTYSGTVDTLQYEALCVTSVTAEELCNDWAQYSCSADIDADLVMQNIPDQYNSDSWTWAEYLNSGGEQNKGLGVMYANPDVYMGELTDWGWGLAPEEGYCFMEADGTHCACGDTGCVWGPGGGKYGGLLLTDENFCGRLVTDEAINGGWTKTISGIHNVAYVPDPNGDSMWDNVFWYGWQVDTSVTGYTCCGYKEQSYESKLLLWVGVIGGTSGIWMAAVKGLQTVESMVTGGKAAGASHVAAQSSV